MTDLHSQASEEAKRWISEAVADYASAWDLTIEQQNDLIGTMVTVFDSALDRVSRERTRQALERAAATICRLCGGKSDAFNATPKIATAGAWEGFLVHERIEPDPDYEVYCQAAPIRGLSDGESVASEEK